MDKFYKCKKFKNLQTEWYAKLKDEGFDDIEWYNPATGNGQGSPHLKRNEANIIMQMKHCGINNFEEYRNLVYLHYSSCRNFLSHAIALPFFDCKLLKLYSNGVTYRDMVEESRNWLCHYPKRTNKAGQALHGYSIFWIHRRLAKLKQDVAVWNSTHEEGIRYSTELEEDDI